ncbi:hypothetical protein BH11PLA1_BH11PLA1_05120 [soil metagenome]
MTLYSVQPSERITFGVEYLDGDVAVVSKRSGLPTQPGLGHEHDTLLNGLFARFGPALQKLGAARDYGLLHRLDKGTSGLLIVALSAKAYDGLRTQFEERQIAKFYWAITSRAPKAPAGMIDRPLLEVEPSRTNSGEKKTSVISNKGKPAQTAYRTLAAGPLGALIDAKPLTGRLHQVRVHLESIGCPILGDTFYAPKSVAVAAPRLALHAHRISFTHPLTGVTVDVRSASPREFKGILAKLKLPTPGELERLEKVKGKIGAGGAAPAIVSADDAGAASDE